MQNFKEMYILSEPINTEIGQLRFLKVKEYPKLIKYIPYINLEKWEMLNIIQSKDTFLATLYEKVDLINIARHEKNTYDLYDKINEFFYLCFNEEVLNKIKNDDEFNYYKSLIREINCISYIPKNLNPEIEKFNQYKKVLQSKNNISFESMYTSVMLYKNDINNLSLYQFYALFNRINMFKSYESSLIAKVLGQDIEICPWYEHVDMNKEEKKETLDIDLESLKNQYCKKLI